MNSSKRSALILPYLFCFIFMGSIPDVIAQPFNQPIDSRQFHFSLWGGYSFNSVKLIGKTPESQSSIIAIGIKTKIREYENGNHLFYTADLVPHLEFHYPKRDENGKRTIRSGWGFSPVGFQLIRPMKFISPFVQMTGGFAYMNDTFPTDKARRLNFTGDFTIGTQISVTDRNILTLGYKFHHISNGQTGSENPGLDSNFLFASFSIH